MPLATGSRKGVGGPKTPEGKRRVSLNAMKHGLNALSNQGLERVAETIGTDFETILDQMRTYYFPRDPIEDMLVTTIARCAWRLKITQAMEDSALDQQMTLRPSKRLEQISILERRIDIQLHRAMSALAAKRREEQQENTQNKLTEVPFPGVTYPWSRRESVRPEPPTNEPTPEPARAGTVAAFYASLDDPVTHETVPQDPPSRMGQVASPRSAPEHRNATGIYGIPNQGDCPTRGKPGHGPDPL